MNPLASIRDGYAQLILKRKSHEFDENKYLNALASIDDGSFQISEAHSVEDMTALYVSEASKTNPDSGVAKEGLGALAPRRRLAVFNLIHESLKMCGVRPRSSDRIAHLLLLPENSQNLGLFDFLTKNKITLKNDEALLQRFQEAVLSGRLMKLWEKSGVLNADTKMARVSKFLSQNQVQVVMGSVINAVLLPSGMVFPFQQNWIRFSPQEIERGIEQGASAYFPKIKLRLGSRMNQNTLLSLSKKIAMNIAIVASTLVVAGDVLHAESDGMDSMRVEIQKSKEERAKSQNEKLFDLWVHEQEEEVGHEIDTTTASYHDARMIYLGK